MDDLTNRKFTGHDAIALINGCANSHDDNQLIYKIIDKNLDIRAGDKVINKAVPNLIPTFSVALAQEYKGKCDWNDSWYASRKLDGVRCLAVVNTEGECTLYSRMGKEFTTLNKIKYAIEATGIINYVFDGEICLLDKDGNEDFQSVMKELRRKDHQIENPTFMIFDMIHKTEFDKGKSTDILSERLHTLRTWLGPRYDTKETLRYLDQHIIQDGRNLLKEQPSPDENSLIDILKDVLERWEKPEYRGGIDSCDRSDHYFEDIKDVIEDYEEETSMKGITMDSPLNEELKNIWEDTIKKKTNANK